MGTEKEVLSEEELSALFDNLSEEEGEQAEDDSGNENGDEQKEPSEKQDSDRFLVFPLLERQTLGEGMHNALRLVFDSFSFKAASALESRLQTRAEVGFEGLGELRYRDFIDRLPEPASMWYCAFRPHDSYVGVCFDRALVHCAIGLLMGGDGSGGERSQITDLDQVVFESVVAVLCSQLEAAWSRLLPVQLERELRETRPRLLQVYPPDEDFVLASLLIRIGNASGKMCWGFPMALIEQLRPICLQFSADGEEPLAETSGRRCPAAVLRLPTHLEARLEQSKLGVAELLDLSVGDVLKLEHHLEQPVTLSVNGRAKFNGSMVVYRDRRAIEIKSRKEL